MDVKLIAIDLNGTLLNNHNKISQESIRAIKQAQKKGIEIAVATRRAFFDVQLLLKEASLSSLWIIGSNGATIHNPEGKLLYTKPLEKKDVEEIVHYFEETALYYELSTNQAIYATKKGKDLLTVEMFKLKNQNPKENLANFLKIAERQYSQRKFELKKSISLPQEEHNYYTVLGITFEKQKRKQIIEHFERKSSVTILQLENYLYELTHAEVSKGNALRYLAWNLNISAKNILVIGDDENDISMFDYAEAGIAMENACKEVKSLAKTITLSNNKDGVAYIITSLT